MLETVSSGFKKARNYLQGQAQLTEENIDLALKEVRRSLLEADVEYSVVKTFLSRVKEKAMGETITVRAKDKKGNKLKLSPAEHFVGFCHEELEALMGPVDSEIRLSRPVGTVMMVGLQGTGKTTTTGKLARYLKKKKHRPMLVAADIYRPAAVEQLKVLGTQLDVPVYADPELTPPELCKNALQKAKEWQCDVVMFDTAGRLAIDDTLMGELEAIKNLVNPDNIFLVVDAMIGQDAVRTAAEFHRRLAIDGFIMTKLDGDARGGAALSIKEITGKPIKFLGMGEHLDNIEPFRPQGLASRILGMGDVVGLVKDFEGQVDEKEAEADAMRMLQGKFSLDDFLKQLRMIKKMGSLQGLLDKIPGMGDMMGGQQVDDKELVKIEAMVLSMTPQERKRPDLFDKQKSRRARVAKGSGRSENELTELLKRFKMMRQLMGAVGQSPGLLGKMPGFSQMAQMAKMGQAGIGGSMGAELQAAMGGMNPFGGGMGRPMAPPSGYYNMGGPGAGPGKNQKAKKDKRKQAAKARKNNRKKRKKK